MPALRTSCLLLAVALAALASGCASTTPKYVRAPSLAPPEPDPQDSRNAYLELIERMQQQGAWYASLAHKDAQCVAELGQGWHQAGGALTGAKVLGDQAQHGLAVIQRRDREAGTGRHCQHQWGGRHGRRCGRNRQRGGRHGGAP